jgi:hypothetical protein
MRTCTWCGKEYPDTAERCAIDEQPLTGGEAPHFINIKRSTLIFSAVNLVVMLVLVLFIISMLQRVPMEEGDYDDSAGNLGSPLILLPVLGASLLLNLVWGVMALIAVCRRRDYRYAAVWAVAVATWAALIVVVMSIDS